MDIPAIRQRLQDERDRLESVRHAAGSLTGDASHSEDGEAVTAAQDGIEQATESIEREIDGSVMQRTEAELIEVDAALQRLESGTYGLCEVCGKPISDGRLEAMPAARYCVDDQARVEREPWLKHNAV